MTISVAPTLLAGALIACLLPITVTAQVAPKNVPNTNVVADAKDVRESVSLLGLQKELTVEGEQLVDTYFVGAETITFKPGVRLVFSDKAIKARTNLIVAARTIVMQDSTGPGVVSWARGDGPNHPRPQSGQAPSGSNVTSDGGSGGPGSPGALVAIIHQSEATSGRDRLFSRDGCAGVRVRCHLGSDLRSGQCGGVRGWWKWVTAGHAAPLFS